MQRFAFTVHGSLSRHGVDKDFKLVGTILKMVRNTLPQAVNPGCLPAHDPVDCCRIVAPARPHWQHRPQRPPCSEIAQQQRIAECTLTWEMKTRIEPAPARQSENNRLRLVAQKIEVGRGCRLMSPLVEMLNNFQYLVEVRRRLAQKQRHSMVVPGLHHLDQHP